MTTDLTEADAICLARIREAKSAVLQRAGGRVRALAAGRWLPHDAGLLLTLLGRGWLEWERNAGTRGLRLRVSKDGLNALVLMEQSTRGARLLTRALEEWKDHAED